MYIYNSQKYTGVAQPTKTTQYRYQIKQESGQPTYNYRREINTDSITNYKYGGNNYQPNKTEFQKYSSKNNQLGNIYTSSSNIGRRNKEFNINNLMDDNLYKDENCIEESKENINLKKEHLDDIKEEPNSSNRKKEIEIIIKPYDINNKSFLNNTTHFSWDETTDSP